MQYPFQNIMPYYCNVPYCRVRASFYPYFQQKYASCKKNNFNQSRCPGSFIQREIFVFPRISYVVKIVVKFDSNFKILLTSRFPIYMNLNSISIFGVISIGKRPKFRVTAVITSDISSLERNQIFTESCTFWHVRSICYRKWSRIPRGLLMVPSYNSKSLKMSSTFETLCKENKFNQTGCPSFCKST